MPWLRRKSDDGWLAISCAADRFDVAHVCRSPGDKPRVTFVASATRGGDDVAALSALRKERRLSGRRCSALLCSGEYQLLQVEAPAVPETEMKQALRWHIKEMVSFPVDSATVELLDIPAEAGARSRAKQVFAVAADNAVLSPRCVLFQESGLALAAIDIPELAQRNVSGLLEDANRGLALLAFDDTGGMLTFTYRGELYAARQIDVGSAMLEQADDARREQLLERVALELQRSLDNFDRLYGHITVARLLVSPMPKVEGMLDALRKDISLAVEELNLADAFDVQGAPQLMQPAQQTRYLKALGAALRN